MQCPVCNSPVVEGRCEPCDIYVGGNAPEPDIIAQTQEYHTVDEKRDWITRQSRYGKENRIVFARVTAHDTIPDLLLYEGWTVRPHDQGSPRFQPVAQ